VVALCCYSSALQLCVVTASVQDEEPKSLEQIVFGDNDDDAEQQNMCIVCWVMKRETTLAPCGHRVLCR